MYSVNAENIGLNIGPQIQRILSHNLNHELFVSGSDSHLSIALALVSAAEAESHDRVQLLITPDDQVSYKLAELIQQIDPNLGTNCLPAFDVGIYSNLNPNAKKVSERISWIYKAQKAESKDIFITSIEALMQQTMPFAKLSNLSKAFNINDDFFSAPSTALHQLGYVSSPIVEDIGQYSIRGGIVDLFSPAHKLPIRLELFADTIDQIKYFDPETQRSVKEIKFFDVVPAREITFNDENRQKVSIAFKNSLKDRNLDNDEEAQLLLRNIAQGHLFPGIDFLLPLFYDSLSSPLVHFSNELNVWFYKPLDLARRSDELFNSLKAEKESSKKQIIHANYEDLYLSFDSLFKNFDCNKIFFDKILIEDSRNHLTETLDFRSSPLIDFQKNSSLLVKNLPELARYISEKTLSWKNSGYKVFFLSHSIQSSERLKSLLEMANLNVVNVSANSFEWNSWVSQQDTLETIHILNEKAYDSLILNSERIVFISDKDIFGRRSLRKKSAQKEFQDKANALSFGDIKPGDLIVHKSHGVGIYKGLEVMPIQGKDSEFIQIQYKGGDKLYLPVYRIGQLQKYSGPGSDKLIDKLGSNQWEKTKSKVKKKLQDIAAELLKLYAKRASIQKEPFSPPDDDFIEFENNFPYIETEDQLKAIGEILLDMTSDKPMDRLICGDVGFGKTEVAMRAAFKAVQDGKQVAVIAPTTVLSFQHLKNFKKRFKNWPIEIKSLNRFVPRKAANETLNNLKSGKVDIVIGTHRLFSKDVDFKNLGLLIIDEEQKFGVKHKERIRQIKSSVDTLALSATPIPRTLNLSLVGIRDLSLINTAPMDRLPTRTFISKFDKDTIHKGVMSEIERGGQVFFLHNRVQSIYSLTDELRELLPNVRIKVAHGQMNETDLEKTMLEFFNHEIDMLVCTTIIESGMDIPNANTMFIDNAHHLGLSQLYQLRGRVGRSKQRAYCYLIIPSQKRLDADAQERLRVIQENTELGSGIKVAQYDLELRGSGDILGSEQSGHVNAVGHELYLELLEEAILEQKGEPPKDAGVDPEINLRVAAYIPANYIKDVKIRLSYYKTLSQIEEPEDLDQIEDDLKDQFGKIPEEVSNLMGLMMIRKQCKDLSIKDLSAGKNILTLNLTEKTPLQPQKIVALTLRENKKYSLSPEQKLKIRMNDITWPRVYEELELLKRFKASTI